MYMYMYVCMHVKKLKTWGFQTNFPALVAIGRWSGTSNPDVDGEEHLQFLDVFAGPECNKWLSYTLLAQSG